MSKEPVKVSAPGKSPGNKPKRKLTRTEKKQIAAAIRQAKGDGKAHTAQQTIPYLTMYPDGPLTPPHGKGVLSIIRGTFLQLCYSPSPI